MLVMRWAPRKMARVGLAVPYGDWTLSVWADAAGNHWLSPGPRGPRVPLPDGWYEAETAERAAITLSGDDIDNRLRRRDDVVGARYVTGGIAKHRRSIRRHVRSRSRP
jgi:hypothetical protein